MGNDWLAAAPEEVEQFIDEPPCAARRDHGLEDMGVANLHAADRLLAFEPVDHGLHGRVGRAVRSRRSLPESREPTRRPSDQSVSMICSSSFVKRGSANVISYQRGYIYYRCR